MAALVLAPGAEFDAEKFRAFLAEQPDLGPKQWPSYVRVSAELPRTVTFKVLKRQLSAAGCRLWRSGVADSPVDDDFPAPRDSRSKRALNSCPPRYRRTSASRSPGRIAPIRWADGGPVSPGRRSRCRWRSRRCAAIGCARKDLAVKAITESDNRASEQLWSGLGDPAEAARQVQGVIAEGGDTATVVESRRLRRGFTAFGQTQWTLQRQARFAARAAFDPRRGRRHRPDAAPHQRSSLGACRQRLCGKRRLGARQCTVTTWCGSSASCPRHRGSGAWRWRPRLTTGCSRRESTSSTRCRTGSSADFPG